MSEMCDGLGCRATRVNSTRLPMPLHSKVNCQWRLGKECPTQFVSKHSCFPGECECHTRCTLSGLICAVLKALNYLASDNYLTRSQRAENSDRLQQAEHTHSFDTLQKQGEKEVFVRAHFYAPSCLSTSPAHKRFWEQTKTYV